MSMRGGGEVVREDYSGGDKLAVREGSIDHYAPNRSISLTQETTNADAHFRIYRPYRLLVVSTKSHSPGDSIVSAQS